MLFALDHGIIWRLFLRLSQFDVVACDSFLVHAIAALSEGTDCGFLAQRLVLLHAVAEECMRSRSKQRRLRTYTSF